MAYVYIYIIAYITYMCPGPAAVRLSACGPCLEALSLSLPLSVSLSLSLPPSLPLSSLDSMCFYTPLRRAA